MTEIKPATKTLVLQYYNSLMSLEQMTKCADDFKSANFVEDSFTIISCLVHMRCIFGCCYVDKSSTSESDGREYVLCMVHCYSRNHNVNFVKIVAEL